MKFKTHAFPSYHSLCSSSPSTGKVVSGFGLGVAVTLIVLILVMLNGPHDLAWPFSGLSDTFFFSGTVAGASVSDSTEGTEMDKIVGQLSEIGWNKNDLGSKKEGLRMGTTGDLSVQMQNGNFLVKGHQDERSSGTVGLKAFRNGILSHSLSNFTQNEKLIANGHLVGDDIMESKRGGQMAIDGSSSGMHTLSTNDSKGGEIRLTDNQDLMLSDNRFQSTGVGNAPLEKCDLFFGRWVKDDTDPYYPPGSCPHIDRDFDCHLNGRPDDEYLRWKWQPYGCQMPSLNATDFLERLRGKKLVFVGDSLNRNMWESLVCILRRSVKDKKRVYEISGRTEFKKKGFYAFRFEDYNCTMDFIGSPFLVKESSFQGQNGTLETLRLDLMDQTTSMYYDADVMVFNTGHWWTHEKTSRGKDYYQEGNYVYPRLKVLKAYKKELLTWARWVDTNVDSNRTLVFFRGYSVTHFRRGHWNSGGQCHNEIEPISDKKFLEKYPSKMRALGHVLEEMRTPVIYLNISTLTAYRKDGHPSMYRGEYNATAEQTASVHSQDCSHWCLPGVPDTWNELLYASLLKAKKVF